MFKRKVKCLDEELYVVYCLQKQKENLCIGPKDLIRIAIYIGVTILMCVIAAIKVNPLLICMTLPIYYGGLLYDMKSMRKRKDVQQKPKKFNSDEFRRETHLQYIKSKSQDTIAYEEALDKQMEQREKNKKCVDLYPQKKEIVERLLYEVDAYQSIYKLPELTLKASTLEMFFNHLYDALYARHNSTITCYRIMSKWLRTVLAKTLCEKRTEPLTLRDLLKYLIWLEPNVLSKTDTRNLEKIILTENLELERSEKIIQFTPIEHYKH